MTQTVVAVLAFVSLLMTTSLASAQFCGDDEGYSPVDDAYEKLLDKDYLRVRLDLVDALQRGEVPSWDRARALSILAQAQLFLGEARPASINFRRAIGLDEAAAGEAAQAGLAAALHARGHDDEARRVAERFADVECHAASDLPVACYGVLTVLAEIGADADERETAERAARDVEAAWPDYTDQFTEVRALVSASRDDAEPAPAAG